MVAHSWIPRFGQIAPSLLSMGFSPVPIKPDTKRSAVPGWPSEPDEQIWLQQYGVWYTGIRTGYNNIVAIDLDVVDEQLARDLLDLAIRSFGPTPLVRIGRAPKSLLVYRTNGSIGKKVTYSDSTNSVVF